MKYMLIMYTRPADAKKITKQELDTVLHKHQKLIQDLTKSGEIINGAGLAYLAESKSIQLDGNTSLVSDAPVPESGEEMTAYYVVECVSEDRAVEIAKSLLDFHVIRTEVRYIHDSNGMTT